MVFALKGRKWTLTAVILAVLAAALIPIIMPKTQVNSTPDGTEIVILPDKSIFNASVTYPGSLFIVNATVKAVTNLTIWQIKLTWDATLLNCTRAFLPTDHVFKGVEDAGGNVIAPSPIIKPGSVQYGASYILPPATEWSFNGTGTLCQIEFKILTPPSPPPVTTNLTLVEIKKSTFLVDIPGDITFTVKTGNFTYFDYLSVNMTPSGRKQVNYGENATFTAFAWNGSLPYRYRWFFKYPNGTEIEITDNENATSWTCPKIYEMGSHAVKVIVSDSANATAWVLTWVEILPLQIAISPQMPPVDVNSNKTFTVSIKGGIPPYKIQWDRNGTEDLTVRNLTQASFNFTQVGKETVRVNVTDSTLTLVYAKTDAIVLPPPTTWVKVIPAVGTGTFYTNITGVGDKVKFNVTIQGVSELENWQINATWDPTLLKINVILPSDHVFAGAEAAGNSLITAGPIFANGSVFYGCTYIPAVPWTFNGTGTICQLEAEIMRQPVASCNVSLIDKYGPMGTTMLKFGVSGKTIPILLDNATYTYVLVPRVQHSVTIQNIAYIVETYSNTSIKTNSVSANQTDKSISFNITGGTGTGAYVNITMPKALIKAEDGSPWKIFINGTDVSSQAIITQDATNTYAYIAFTFASLDTIRAKGTWIVPEQTHILLIALMIASAVAVVLTRTSKRKWIK